MEKFEIREYVTAYGKNPFHSWFRSLRDNKVKARILSRLDRVQLGNLGDHKSVGDGVNELRLAYGSGFRIYYGISDNTIVILLCGGDKSSQRKDIQKAKQYWSDYRS